VEKEEILDKALNASCVIEDALQLSGIDLVLEEADEIT
jgi:hypothetical protein